MKQNLPFHILLLLALGASGFAVYYNLALRADFATTLRYAYPVVEQAPTQRSMAMEKEKPGETIDEGPVETLDEEPAETPDEEAEDEPLTAVEFPLDINTATVEQLKFIPQVGDVMAQRIYQYRDYLGGRYTDLAQLRGIKGVGDQTFVRLCTYLTIGEETAPVVSEELYLAEEQ